MALGGVWLVTSEEDHSANGSDATTVCSVSTKSQGREGDTTVTRLEMIEALSASSDLILLMRGHLILEVLLNRLIALVAPSECDELDRLRFNQKLDVVIALGALPADARSAWRLVNNLRNRFGHDLRAELTQRDSDDLLNAMPAVMRASIRQIHKAQDAVNEGGQRTPSVIVGSCIGWLATFASRAVVENGGEPMQMD